MQVPDLQYERRPSTCSFACARLKRIGIVLAGTIAVVTAGVWVQPKAKLLYHQSRCAHHSGRADEMVYEELPLEHPPVHDPHFVEFRTGVVVSRVRLAPIYLRELQASLDLSPARREPREAVLFLGRLRSPDGGDRIVCVSRRTRDNSATTLADTMICLVVTPANALKPAKARFTATQPRNASRWVVGTYAKRFSLFAGQPDPADSSHFTVRYCADDDEGHIDGWLQADDTVRLDVRDGPAFVRPKG